MSTVAELARVTSRVQPARVNSPRPESARVESAAESVTCELSRQTGDFFFPVTFAQQWLWFLDQLHPGNTSYLIPWNIRISGLLDVEALRVALRELVRRPAVW